MRFPTRREKGVALRQMKLESLERRAYSRLIPLHQSSSGPLPPPCGSAFGCNHPPQRFHQHLVTPIEGLGRGELARIVAQSILTWDKNQRRRNFLLDRQCVVSRDGLQRQCLHSEIAGDVAN